MRIIAFCFSCHITASLLITAGHYTVQIAVKMLLHKQEHALSSSPKNSAMPEQIQAGKPEELQRGEPNYEVISYLKLRQFIGLSGLSLPFLLILGSILLNRCDILLPSISHYYYSVMHIVFVGVLCILGGFLITYRGKSVFENRTSNFAGIFALGVAIFPTSNGCEGYEEVRCSFLRIIDNRFICEWANYVHFGMAVLLFTCFVIFCLKIFQQSDLGIYNEKKARRNRTYKICGYIIIASIVAIAAITLYRRMTGKLFFPKYIFVFETSSLLAFGFSWLLKGSVLWPAEGGMKKQLVKYFRD